MNTFINKIYRFMNGRYGYDELYKFMIFICLIITIVSIFIDSLILKIIEVTLFVLSLFRFLSKNKSKRLKENKKYIEVKESIKRFTSFQIKKYKDRNKFIYKKCSKCKQKIRLPLKKGKHIVCCPRCKHRFSVKCSRNEKIEIVK